MAKFMSEQTCDQVIPISTAANFGNHRVATVNEYGDIVGARHIGILRLPIQIDVDPPVVFVPAGLCRCNVLKVASKDPGGEELLIRDLTALLIQKLLYALMIDSSHCSSSLSRGSATLGRKDRFQDGSLQGLTVLFIRGSLADNGAQGGPVGVAGDLRTGDPVDETSHTAGAIGDAILTHVLGHGINDLNHLGYLVLIGGTGNCHRTLGHHLGRRQFDVLHQTHSVNNGLVEATTALVSDVSRDNNNRIRMPLNDLAGRKRDRAGLLQEGVQTNQNTGLGDDGRLR